MPTASLTGALAGAVTVKATLNGAAVTSTASVNVTIGTTASASTSTVSAASSVVSGSSITVTLQAKDAAGNSLSAGGATVVFSIQSGSGTASVGSTTDHGNGAYTTSLTGALAGSVTVKATLNGAAVSSTAPVNVTVGTTASASTSTVSAASSVVSGSSITVTLRCMEHALDGVPSLDTGVRKFVEFRLSEMADLLPPS